jgi:pimeloyl-ACP methyl ester carboxylesterase
LRGYGETRFLSADTLRSGQQAALGNDLLELLDALGVQSAALVGYDWGGRAACVVAALWPERARCLVTANGYNIQNIAESVKPRPPEQEHRAWYQYYFHTEARSRRPHGEPQGIRQTAVAPVVAELEIRRRDLRAHRSVVRQSRFR